MEMKESLANLEKFMNNKFRCIDSQLHTIEVAQEYFNDISKNYDTLQEQIKKLEDMNKLISEKVEGAMLEALPEWREVLTDKLKDMLLPLLEEKYLTIKEHIDLDTGINKMVLVIREELKHVELGLESHKKIGNTLYKELYRQKLIPEHIIEKINNMVKTTVEKHKRLDKELKQHFENIDNSEMCLFTTDCYEKELKEN